VPSVPGIDIRQLSEIRRVEGEIDGIREGGVAWLTEGVELDKEGDEEVEDRKAIPVQTNSQEATTSSRPQRTIRPTYKVKSGQE
jgi:hypothetical protein